jgi:hypothetical protein
MARRPELHQVPTGCPCAKLLTNEIVKDAVQLAVNVGGDSGYLKTSEIQRIFRDAPKPAISWPILARSALTMSAPPVRRAHQKETRGGPQCAHLHKYSLEVELCPGCESPSTSTDRVAPGVLRHLIRSVADMLDNANRNAGRGCR